MTTSDKYTCSEVKVETCVASQNPQQIPTENFRERHEHVLWST